MGNNYERKTKEICVCFSTYDTAALPPLIVDGCNISVVSHAKLLGLIISKTSSGFFMLTLFGRKLRNICMLYDY